MSERAVFDCRVWVAGEDAKDVYRRLNQWLASARMVAPQGLEVRYTTLRHGHPLSGFHPTIVPKRGRRAA